jgi:hypothetical protein
MWVRSSVISSPEGIRRRTGSADTVPGEHDNGPSVLLADGHRAGFDVARQTDETYLIGRPRVPW